MGNYAVYHTEKGSSSSGGIGNHIDRTEGMEHTFQHADPERRHLNQNFRVPKDRQNMSLSDAINDRIKEGYNGKRKIRTDAVKFQTHILTGSHERMKEIFENPELAKKWLQANYKFVQDEFGKENLVRFTLHRDEKTPHIHAVTVPLTADGRLSAKETIGNKKAMQERQDRYAKAMQPFGLERGIKNTGIKHENATEYYARMKKANDIGDENEIKASKNVLGVYTPKSVSELENAVKSQKTALKSKELELQKEKELRKQTIETTQIKLKKIEVLQWEKQNLIQEIKKLENKNLEMVFLNPEERAAKKEEIKQFLIDQVKNGKDSDDLIRESMRIFRPNDNVWATIRKEFGEDFENRLGGLQIERDAKQQEERKRREQQKRQEPEKDKGRRFRR